MSSGLDKKVDARIKGAVRKYCKLTRTDPVDLRGKEVKLIAETARVRTRYVHEWINYWYRDEECEGEEA